MEILNKIIRRLGLCLFLIATSNSLAAQSPLPDPQWEKEIVAFELQDKKLPPPVDGIVFVGSSSIRKWTSLQSDFPGLPVYNRGFGGSQLIDSVRYADRILIPYHPKMIVLYAGSNDIAAGKSVDQVFQDFQEFIGVVRAKLPMVKIAYLANAPNPKRWALVDKYKDLNQRIAALIAKQENMVFIDVYTPMIGEDGGPRPELFTNDNLHMNSKGYLLWTGIVKPYLQ